MIRPSAFMIGVVGRRCPSTPPSRSTGCSRPSRRRSCSARVQPLRAGLAGHRAAAVQRALASTARRPRCAKVTSLATSAGMTCSPLVAGVLEQRRRPSLSVDLGDEVRVAVDAAGGEGGEADAPGRSGASRTRRCRSRRRCRRSAGWPASCCPRGRAACSATSRACRWPARTSADVLRARPRRPGRRRWCSATW